MPKSPGKYPFSTYVNRYLQALIGHRAELTLEQMRRDFNTIGGDVQALYETRRLSSTNPTKMTVQDLAAILGFWRVRPKRGPNAKNLGEKLDPTSQKHLWTALKGLLEYCGNGAVGQLKTLPYVELPRTLEKPIDIVSAEQQQSLRGGAETIEGWRGAVARFLVDFCPGTGLRPKEVRLQELTCIDPAMHRGIVCHPKGEGRYATAHKESFTMSDEAEQALQDLIAEREKFLNGRGHPALIPFEKDNGELDHWPESSLRKLMADLRKASGVQVNLQEFRATFGQRSIDGGAKTESVSRAMRHKTTATTERYYARVRPEQALDEVRQALTVKAR